MIGIDRITISTNHTLRVDTYTYKETDSLWPHPYYDKAGIQLRYHNCWNTMMQSCYCAGELIAQMTHVMNSARSKLTVCEGVIVQVILNSAQQPKSNRKHTQTASRYIPTSNAQINGSHMNVICSCAKQIRSFVNRLFFREN